MHYIIVIPGQHLLGSLSGRYVGVRVSESKPEHYFMTRFRILPVGFNDVIQTIFPERLATSIVSSNLWITMSVTSFSFMLIVSNIVRSMRLDDRSKLHKYLVAFHQQ